MKIIISAILLFFYTIAIAQRNETDINTNEMNFSNSTPDVASFEKVQLNSIKKYSGKADISIPIYTINSGSINFPINLSYNTGGIKVDQLASDVGLGWSLSQCLVTRTINSGNDFNGVGYNRYPNSGYSFATPQELTYDQRIWETGNGKLGYFLNQSLNKKITPNDRTIDYIPDQYNFYSSEFNTNFFFQNINTPIEINPRGTKITATKGKQLFDSQLAFYSADNLATKCYDFPTQDFFTISIVSKEGIKYIFNDYDLAINFPKTPLSEYFNISYGNQLNPNPASISAWHISQIEDMKTGKKINFEYDTTHSNPWKNIYSLTRPQYNLLYQSLQKSYSYTRASESQLYQFPCFYWTQFDSFDYRLNLNINMKADVQKKRLKRIVFDEGSIEYKYNNEGGIVSGIGNQREDLFNGDFVTQIIIKNNKNEIIKSFDFLYDYLISNYSVGEFNPDGAFNPYRYKRLKLTGMKEKDKPKYSFDYIENIKLPPVNSFSIDFLGYYNSSGDVTTENQIFTMKPGPKLYYYPNNFEKSLLPFPVPNVSSTVINGYFNREANNSAQAWSLKKITYPTGGTSEFIYEPNQFQMFGENITGGGMRIQRQLLGDGMGNTRTVEYSYLNDAGKSSGTLSSLPYFGHPELKFFEVNVNTRDNPPTAYSGSILPDNVHWKVYDKSNINKDLTSGAYVGYSKVTEREIGNGRIESYYTSNDLPEYRNRIYRIHPMEANVTTGLLGGNTCLSDFIISNSGLDSETFTDNSYQRGHLLEEYTYTENSDLILKNKNEYTDFSSSSFQFEKPVTYPVRTQGENNLGHLISVVKKYEVKNFQKIKETTIQYAPGNNISVEKQYTYNGDGFLKTSTEALTNEVIENKYYYPKDNELSAEPMMAMLVTKNIIGTPIKIENYSNSSKISERKTVYANDATTSGLLLPKYIYSQIGENNIGVLEKKITYDKYDNKGNLLQYTQENGIPVSVIWGYNQTYPIAKIENAEYLSIPSQLISDAQAKSNSGTETQLIGALNALRNNLPNAMTTGFTYSPLIGIKTVIDFKGVKTFYEYDESGRLKSVKDNEGNFLSQNKYHYRP